MAASRCVDTFVISIISDLDCYLKIIGQAGDNGDEREFILSPGNEQPLMFTFEYYIGVGADTSHDDFGFISTLDELNTGNAKNMSLSDGQFNPPSPDTTGAVNALKTATLTFAAAAIANIIYPNPNEVGDAATGANNQNLGGEIILNTGVIEP